MPLKAYWNNEKLIAPLLSTAEWLDLQCRVKSGGILRMPCCGSGAFLRTSKLGTRHFVHLRKGDCGAEGETLEHLRAKAELAKGCNAAGFDVETEAEGDGWRADVLAVKGNVRIALEVQWSRQTMEVTKERQAVYRRAGIRCAWLFRKLPDRAIPCEGIPMFGLASDEMVTVEPNDLPLAGFAESLLRGRFRFCRLTRALPEQEVHLRFVEYECWRCKRPCHVFRVPYERDGIFRSVHGGDFSVCGTCGESFEHTIEVLDAVRAFLQGPEGSILRVGTVKRRYSHTRRREYLSQGCPYCDALFGDWFLFAEPDIWEAPAVAEMRATVRLRTPLVVEKPHWCYSETGRFCCDDSL